MSPGEDATREQPGEDATREHRKNQQNSAINQKHSHRHAQAGSGKKYQYDLN